MRKILVSAVAVVLGAISITPAPVAAQAYPIDCAILLCLSGGWPTSVPCTRARAEFIGRITPWPIEPPLQIWRCPMSIAFAPGSISIFEDHVYHAGFDRIPSPGPTKTVATLHSAVSTAGIGGLPEEARILLAQAVGTGADIDLSDAVFDFLRSIRVWDVRHYSHQEHGQNDTCDERSRINLGTYDRQGQFRWDRSDPAALPTWLLPSRECRVSNVLRAVGVEWRDYAGNHGHEIVRY